MKLCGLITEYNPFHNGHNYHLHKAKEITGCDAVIAFMSGDFVQRGEPAVFDKYFRAKCALMAGADLVIELPSFVSCMSAEYFARGAIQLMNSLHCIDALCFGSESGDINQLSLVSLLLSEETPKFKETLKLYLDKGFSFPKARQSALLECLSFSDSALFSSPNDILGIEYLRALKNTNSLITPYALQRTSNNYHSTDTASNLCSATALRELIFKCNKDFTPIKDLVPDELYSEYTCTLNNLSPMEINDFSQYLLYSLLWNKAGGYTQFADVSEQLSAKICNNLANYESFGSFCSTLKSKDLTYTRICRSLLHIMLGITQKQIEEYDNLYSLAPYCKVLGFRKEAKEILSTFVSHSSVPVITNLSDAPQKLDSLRLDIFQKELRISELYQSMVALKSGTTPANELSRKMLVL